MKLSFCATTVAFAAWVIPCVYGQSGCSGDIKVTAQGDLDALRSCKSFKGSITIDGTAANQLTLDGVQHIDGDLNVKNNEVLSRLSLPNLQAVNGVVNLENNKALNSLDMPYLSAVRSFTMAVHPALPSISFPAGLSQVDRLMISDTTTTRIEGVKASQIGELVVDNNIYLKSLNLGNLSKVTTGLTVSANSPSLTLDLSHVQSLHQGSFRNLAGVSLDSLGKVDGDLSFISNTFSSLELPNVTEIAGTLTLSNNKQLSKLALPELHHLGGALSLGNNTELGTVDAFPKLEEVDGTLDLTGSFQEVKLPALSDVRGGLNIQTTSDKFSCEEMNKLKNGVIKGNSFVCKSRVANPKSGIPGKGGSGGGGAFGDDTSGGTIMLTRSSFSALVAAVVLCLFVL